MSIEKGSLSIHSENIFPIIKKWLYSDHDIFVREIISNASDAITKLKQLSSMNEARIEENAHFQIEVTLDEAAKTITFSDNGIGMTDEEIKKYINQIAFSGAEDFLNKYKDKSDKEQIIGHFGLGFYSSFMVAEQVEIHTLSYQSDAVPALWRCDGGTEFELEKGSRNKRGTDVILHISDDGKEFLNEYTLRNVIKKYCSFMPYDIFLTVVGKELSKDADGNVIIEEPKPLNTTLPLYAKSPSDCTDEDYKTFYRTTFNDHKEPLFWIHLNMDYPFNLKGILFFPKMNTEFDTMEGQIKLYNSQVFVADNIKEVIPEFLLLLKGVIDCPDLPLNVSRSFLQNDGFVKRISNYISKKVADKLSGLFKTEREQFEGFWDDISPFIKFGGLKDDKFFESLEAVYLFKTLEDKYVTLQEYLDAVAEKHENKIFYVSDAVQQAQYIKLFKDHALDAVLLTHSIDAPFISLLESKKEAITFSRIDADLNEHLKGEEHLSEADKKIALEKLQEMFKKALGIDDFKLKLEAMKTDELSAMVVLSEESRRMQDMMRMYGMPGMDPNMFKTETTLILNSRNALVTHLLENETLDSETRQLICEHLYDLAMISHAPLSAEAMTKFINRSNTLMLKLV